jgi:hypothetical protein
MMDVDFFLRFAQSLREMMRRARTDVVREQLRIWAEEFEERAAVEKPELHAEPLPK